MGTQASSTYSSIPILSNENIASLSNVACKCDVRTSVRGRAGRAQVLLTGNAGDGHDDVVGQAIYGGVHGRWHGHGHGGGRESGDGTKVRCKIHRMPLIFCAYNYKEFLHSTVPKP